MIFFWNLETNPNLISVSHSSIQYIDLLSHVFWEINIECPISSFSVGGFQTHSLNLLPSLPGLYSPGRPGRRFGECVLNPPTDNQPILVILLLRRRAKCLFVKDIFIRINWIPLLHHRVITQTG